MGQIWRFRTGSLRLKHLLNLFCITSRSAMHSPLHAICFEKSYSASPQVPSHNLSLGRSSFLLHRMRNHVPVFYMSSSSACFRRTSAFSFYISHRRSSLLPLAQLHFHLALAPKAIFYFHSSLDCVVSYWGLVARMCHCCRQDHWRRCRARSCLTKTSSQILAVSLSSGWTFVSRGRLQRYYSSSIQTI